MALREREHRFTEDEYFLLESESDERHEYFDGIILNMAGASQSHSTITANLIAAIHAQTRGAGRRGCYISGSDTRVQAFTRPTTPKIIRLPKRAAYYLPDVIALCGEPEYREERGVPVLLNPALIIEVLSPSTQAFDIGEKGKDYRGIPSLQDFVLISQDEMHIRHYARTGHNAWQFMELTASDDVLNLNNMGCTLTLAQIYDEVAFVGEDEEDEADEEKGADQ